MAKWRAIHASITTDGKVNRMSEFAQLLYDRVIVVADDWGVVSGDMFELKGEAVPTSARPLEDLEAAVSEMEAAGLITRYEDNEGTPLVYIRKWDEHQPATLIGKRTVSQRELPAELEGCLSASEKDIEADVAERIEDGRIRLSKVPLIQLERARRIGNRYLDILCRDEDGAHHIIEVKRSRLRKAALKQITNYRDLIMADGAKQATCTLVGHGLSTNFALDAALESGVDVIVYDDDVIYRQLTSVNSALMLNDAPSLSTNVSPIQDKTRQEETREEESRSDKNKNRGRDAAAPDPPLDILARLESLGIANPVRDELTQLEHVTCEYLEAWRAWVHDGGGAGLKNRAGYLVKRIRAGDEPPTD